MKYLNAWKGTLAKAQGKCSNLAGCIGVHDADADGKDWRYCKDIDKQEAGGADVAVVYLKAGGSPVALAGPFECGADDAVELSFRHPAEIITNNLGGFGPDTDKDPVLRIKRVGKRSRSDGGAYVGTLA